MTQFITLPFHKGIVLVLTAEEFQRALARGKAKLRREQFEQHQAQREKRLARYGVSQK